MTFLWSLSKLAFYHLSHPYESLISVLLIVYLKWSFHYLSGLNSPHGGHWSPKLWRTQSIYKNIAPYHNFFTCPIFLNLCENQLALSMSKFSCQNTTHHRKLPTQLIQPTINPSMLLIYSDLLLT